MNGFAARDRERIAVRPFDAAAVRRLSEALAIPHAAAVILAGRDLRDPETCRAFFSPKLDNLHDPFLFPDMQKAVERIAAALEKKETIVIYGDYDADGITGTALLMRVLESLGGRCSYVLPNRLTEGYGLSEQGVRQAAAAGARCVITVDCGITALDEIARAAEHGMDVIVTDHHEPGQRLPAALALLNPKIVSCPYPDKNLAGVGVALKLCQALGVRTGKGGALWEPYLDLVALGTAADVVPLIGENRIIAHAGFRQLRQTKNPGLAALIEAQGLAGKPLSTREVAFQLAPCINAGGRLGDPRRGVELLLAGSVAAAAPYARELRTANSERRALDRKVFTEACAWVEAHCSPEHDYALVAGSASWHAGVIGIAAAKLVERFHRPAVLFAVGSDGISRGSGRSIDSLHLLEAISECGDLLESFGGHKAAAGIHIASASIDAFRTRFNETVRKRLSPEDLLPTITADAEVSLDACTPGLFSLIAKMEPFGPGNACPVLYCRGLRICAAPRIVGNDHLKMRVSGNGTVMDAIAFGFGGRLDEIGRAESVSIAFALDENEWNGRTSLQMNIKGIGL